MGRSGRVLVIAILAACSFGCRFKSWESFESATTPAPRASEWKGDEGSFGGIPEATGGLKTQTSYGYGARAGMNNQLNASYDQPAKGSGQQAGENTVEAAAGYGKVNGPAFQSSPSVIGSTTMRSSK